MSRRFEHRHLLPHPPARVWATLVDLAGWPRWNTLSATAPEGLVPGAPLQLVISLGGRGLPATATLTEVVPQEALVWRGGPRRLFCAEHGFRLRPAGEGTEVLHFETFEGLLVRPILGLVLRGQAAKYGQVNRRLGEVCGEA